MEYINLKNNYTKDDIIKTSEIIKSGKIAILPTDTVYGLVVDALNEDAVRRLYNLKHRDFCKPCSVITSDIEMIKKITKKLEPLEEKIIENFLPGALTIVLKKNEKIPSIVTANLDTIGVRIPDNKFLIEVVKNLRKTNSCNKLKFIRRRK